MTDLDRRLAALGETPLAAPPTLPELHQRAGRIRRRRQARRVGGVLVAAGLLVALWSVADEPGTRQVEFPPADQGMPEPVPASEWPLGLVVADRPGVYVVPFDAADQAILLGGDRFYENVMWAYPDQRGGLVFQHGVTPPPWAPGTVLWLRAGAPQPEVLIPPEAPWDPEASAGILPIGMATASDGRALFLYAVQDLHPDGSYDWFTSPTRIMVADLDGGGVLRQLAVVEGSIDPFLGRYQAVAGAGVVALIDGRVEDCPTVTRLSLDDGAPIPTTTDCGPGPTWMALSHDGRALGWIGHEGTVGTTVTVIDLSTGAIAGEATLGRVDLVSPGLTASRGGWLAYAETPDEILLLDLDGAERFRIDKTSLPLLEWSGRVFPYHHPFNLASGARLGSGSGERPCQAFTNDLPVQDLPEPVAATRQVLFDLAAACDYEGLAALARDHTTLLFVNGHATSFLDDELGSDEDLIRSWVAEGRADDGIRSGEPLATLAALLRAAPVYVEDASDLPESQPHREGSVWVWPAQYVEAEGDPREPVMHDDYRLGIAPDGTWRFFMAGDFRATPAPSYLRDDLGGDG